MDATEDLSLARGGDRHAAERLMPLVYDELRRLAAAYLRRERAGHTLQPTALVHEAYLRLVDQTRARFEDRDHFTAIAAKVMRRILVDHARAKAAAKRDIEGAPRSSRPTAPTDTFLEIDEALARLEAHHERQARVVELRYFGGLEVAEIARLLGVSDRTVKSDWAEASAFLRRDWTRAEHHA
jgi:RNA polymerase sigma-70 factor, ECF subfamily